MSLRACSKSVRPRRDFDTFLTILKKMRGLFTFVKFSIYTSGLDSVKRLGFAGLVAWKSLLVVAKSFLILISCKSCVIIEGFAGNGGC